MLLEQQNFNAIVKAVDKNNMSNYPNILTPPSSSEDSPQPVYFVASPNSSSFHAPENYASTQMHGFDIFQQTHLIIDQNMVMDSLPGPSLHFVEQPTDRFRFRYKSEMAGTHGSLTGFNSDKSRKQTYPTVELRNCTGPAIIRCSIYQINANGRDMMPHAHRLIMKKGKEEHDDPHDMAVGPEDGYKAVFHGMGIIHTAKKNIINELMRKKTQLKKELIARTEPTGMRELTLKEQVEIKGLAENESKSINLNIVVLRFDAFIKQNGILRPICDPIFSHGINNLKSALTGELKIVRLDHCTSPAKGGKEVFVLVERVTKKNIKIRFFELDDDEQVIWEDYGKFNDLDVHHQYAIVFRTPKFRDEAITSPVKVFMELVRPSDNARSEPREFTYVPSAKPGGKRPRHDYSSSSYDSSSMGSNELPVVINELRIGQQQSGGMANLTNNSWNASSLLNEDEALQLTRAITDIDSSEFTNLYLNFGMEHNNIMSNAIDAPMDCGLTRPHVIKTPLVKKRKEPISDSVPPTKPLRGGVIKLEVSQDEKQMAQRHYAELSNFARTTHTKQQAIVMLNHYLGEDVKTNALHVFICQNAAEKVTHLLKMTAIYGQLDLVNVRNTEGQTPLALSVQCYSKPLVARLLACRARVGQCDDRMSSALHQAVEWGVPIEIIEALLQDRECEKVENFIDLTNGDGNTALLMAMEAKNLDALKLLCRRGADVNKASRKNGFTPLRVAIERQYLDGIRHLLSLPNLEAEKRDAAGVSPFAAAHHQESSREIVELIQRYMQEHNIEMDVKEEPEEESDEEKEDEMEVKNEPIAPEELEQLYHKTTRFTPECLRSVAAILDESGKWEDLADLLDIGHIARSGVIPMGEGDISRHLLTYAVEENHGTIWEIRNFLENLDETKAVEIIDKMVRNTN